MATQIAERPSTIRAVCAKCGNKLFAVSRHEAGYTASCRVCSHNVELNRDFKPHTVLYERSGDQMSLDKRGNGGYQHLANEYPWGIACTLIQIQMADKTVIVGPNSPSWVAGLRLYTVYVYHIPAKKPTFRWHDRFLTKWAEDPSRQIYAVEIKPWYDGIEQYSGQAYNRLRMFIRDMLDDALGVPVLHSPNWDINQRR